MKDRTSFWIKQAVFQLLLAGSVLVVADGVLRDQNDFVVWYVQRTSPDARLSLWQGVTAASPFGTFAALALGLGALLTVLLRGRLTLAEAWLLQLVITALLLGSLWRSISLELTAIWHIGR